MPSTTAQRREKSNHGVASASIIDPLLGVPITRKLDCKRYGRFVNGAEDLPGLAGLLKRTAGRPRPSNRPNVPQNVWRLLGLKALHFEGGLGFGRVLLAEPSTTTHWDLALGCVSVQGLPVGGSAAFAAFGPTKTDDSSGMGGALFCREGDARCSIAFGTLPT